MMTKFFRSSLSSLVLAASLFTVAPQITLAESPRTTYHTTSIDGVKIFYREAGSPSKPTIVLLHGFPSSSHMYRELIPKLADEYHVIAPDYPGYGYSDSPTPNQFEYTFDHLAEVTDDFLKSLRLQRYSIYIQDYGAPIGLRLFTKHPSQIQAIISQNGNAYNEGLSPFWAEYLEPYWNNPTPETEAKVRQLLTIDMTKFQYSKGYRNPENISPDAYTFDQAGLDRPENAEIQVALFYDYRNNLKLYPQWQEALRKNHPPVLVVWGKNDPIFIPPGALAFKRDVPKAEIHLLNTGHFALEEDSEEIATLIRTFLSKVSKYRYKF